jgi:hypothetical protein
MSVIENMEKASEVFNTLNEIDQYFLKHIARLEDKIKTIEYNTGHLEQRVDGWISRENSIKGGR